MLSLNDLEKEYLGLKKENFQDGKRIKFIANLGASDEIAYHYESSFAKSGKRAGS